MLIALNELLHDSSLVHADDDIEVPVEVDKLCRLIGEKNEAVCLTRHKEDFRKAMKVCWEMEVCHTF